MPGRQGSSCASLCGGPAGGIIARPSAVRPAGVYARTQPDGMARRVGESLCASSVVREAAPAKLVRPRLGKGDPVGLPR